MRQYFIDETVEINESIQLSESQRHHVCDVLRMSSKDRIRIVDKNNRIFLSSLRIDKNAVWFDIEKELENSEDDSEIVLIAAMIKKEKWEMIIQKSCELGVDRIVPLISDRTIIHLEEKDIDKKISRYNQIALEACQQSNRGKIVTVEKPIRMKDISKYMQQVNFICYENEDDLMITDLDLEKSCCFVIGPEGGFTEKEIEYLKGLDFTSVSLGSDILRAETAVMFSLSVIKAKRFKK